MVKTGVAFGIQDTTPIHFYSQVEAHQTYTCTICKYGKLSLDNNTNIFAVFVPGGGGQIKVIQTKKAAKFKRLKKAEKAEGNILLLRPNGTCGCSFCCHCIFCNNTIHFHARNNVICIERFNLKVVLSEMYPLY